MRPLMLFLGAGSGTYAYASSYAFCVIVCGGVPTILSNTLSALIRSVGESGKAGFGITMGGLINIALDPLFMFVAIKPKHIASKRKRRIIMDVGKITATVYIVLGIIIEVIAMLFTYIAQYFDMQMNGSSYANSCDYLMDPPLVFAMVIGVICIVTGICISIKNMKNRKDDSI